MMVPVVESDDAMPGASPSWKGGLASPHVPGAVSSKAPLVERLRLHKMIGVGGFARVFDATLDGRRVALKVLLEEHANAANGHKRRTTVK